MTSNNRPAPGLGKSRQEYKRFQELRLGNCPRAQRQNPRCSAGNSTIREKSLWLERKAEGLGDYIRAQALITPLALVDPGLVDELQMTLSLSHTEKRAAAEIKKELTQLERDFATYKEELEQVKKNIEAKLTEWEEAELVALLDGISF